MISSSRQKHICQHENAFLSDENEGNELKTWVVMFLCTCSMIIEIVCGVLFGSLALVADGIHMGTHVIAFFISAAAYSFARKHSDDEKFVFGTGKVGELAAFTSAILLIVISLVIMYEGVERLIYPEELHYMEALPIAFIGLAVNILSGLVLMGVFDFVLCCGTPKNGSSDLFLCVHPIGWGYHCNGG